MTHDDPKIPIKVYQILLLFLGIQIAWALIFQYIAVEVPNFSYLQVGASTLTVTLLCRYVMSNSGSSFERLLGRRIHSSDMLEIFVLGTVTVVCGIGAWALLVLVGASFDPKATFEHFGLVSDTVFSDVEWLGSWVFIYLLAASVLAPISEELVFRGLILRRIRQRHGTMLAVFVSSALFGLLHYDKSFIGAFLHGLLLAAMALRFRSLWPGIIAHGLYNATTHFLRLKWGIGLRADLESIDSVIYWVPELVGLWIGLLLSSWYVLKVVKTDRAGKQMPNHPRRLNIRYY